MRWAVLTIVATALAGCTVEDNPASNADVADGPPLDIAMALPADWDIEATMPPSTSDTPAADLGDDPPCSDPMTETCHTYPFELGRTANVTLVLSWLYSSNDLDLYIFQDDEPLPPFDNGGGIAPTREFHRTLLSPGSYEVKVAGYLSTATPDGPGTTYRLQAFFDEP